MTFKEKEENNSHISRFSCLSNTNWWWTWKRNWHGAQNQIFVNMWHSRILVVYSYIRLHNKLCKTRKSWPFIVREHRTKRGQVILVLYSRVYYYTPVALKERRLVSQQWDLNTMTASWPIHHKRCHWPQALGFDPQKKEKVIKCFRLVSVAIYRLWNLFLCPLDVYKARLILKHPQ